MAVQFQTLVIEEISALREKDRNDSVVPLQFSNGTLGSLAKLLQMS